MTRAEHLAWVKQRALAFLPGDPAQAMASMMSDMKKHPETRTHLAIQHGVPMMASGLLNSAEKVRDFIVGIG